MKTSKRKLEAIVADLTAVLKRGTADIVEVGRLLDEAKLQVKHGAWAKWLSSNFSLSRQSSDNYRKAYLLSLKMPTIGDLRLQAAALYHLCTFDDDSEVLAAVAEEAKDRWVDSLRIDQIHGDIVKKRQEEKEAAEKEAAAAAAAAAAADTGADDGGGAEAGEAEGDNEAEQPAADADEDDAGADGEPEQPPANEPVPDDDKPPATAEPVPPGIRLAMDALTAHVTGLKLIYTKSITTFVGTTPTAEELRAIAAFLIAIADAKARAPAPPSQTEAA
jgi:hypothetical protein